METLERIEHSSNRTTWLKERRRGVGASEVAALMGLSPWDTPLTVYAAKVGAPEDNEPTEAERWGQLLEPLVLAEYARRRGVALVGAGIGGTHYAGTLLHNPRYPHLLATPDEVQTGAALPWDGPGLVEVKTTAPVWRDGKKVDPYEDGEVPLYVLAQVQAQLMVTGLRWATVVWFKLPERTMHWQDVEAHEGFQAEIAEAVEAFWRHVETLDPPEATWTDRERELIKGLYPRAIAPAIDLTPEQRRLVATWESVSADARALDKQADELGAAVRLILRDAVGARLGEGRVLTAKEQTRTTVCKACGHTETSKPFRVLRIGKEPKQPSAPRLTPMPEEET